MSDFMKSLSKIAIPVTLQSMLQASFSIIDQIMIGQLGEVNIAAVGLYGNFSLIFSVVIGSVGTVAGILIAQFTGADNEREAWCSLNVSLLCGALLSVLFLLAAGGFPTQILQLYTADGRIQQAGAVYFKTVAFAYLPMALSTILSAWLRCKEHAAVPFWASLGAVAANTGLELPADIRQARVCPHGGTGCCDCHTCFAAAEFLADFTGLCGLPQKGWQSPPVGAAF